MRLIDCLDGVEIPKCHFKNNRVSMHDLEYEPGLGACAGCLRPLVKDRISQFQFDDPHLQVLMQFSSCIPEVCQNQSSGKTGQLLHAVRT